MKATMCLAAVAAAPLALAQTYDSRPSRPPVSGMETPSNRAMSGSTGDAAMNREAGASSNRSTMRGTSVDRADIATRRGRGQNDLELSQTSLLNQFSAAGYTMVRDFRKDGAGYVAQARDRDGRWASVELNPRSGAITPR